MSEAERWGRPVTSSPADRPGPPPDDRPGPPPDDRPGPPPEVRSDSPPGDRSDSYPAYAAVATMLGVFGVLAAGLIFALTFDVRGRRSGPSSWEVRVTIASLASSFGTTAGGGTFVAVALLVALGLVHSSTGAGRPLAVLVGVGACVASGWLGIATALAIYVDFDLPSNVNGTVAGLVLGNLSTLVVLAAAAAWGAATATTSR